MEIDECGFILMEAESKFGIKADELDSTLNTGRQ